ncbi:MAG: N-methyl-D-aspartate receptor NMDAR2C subunit [Betaproteobacteria bacterium]
MSPIDLEAAWNDTWNLLELRPVDASCLPTLLGRWREPHRKYHTLQHLRECLALFEAHRGLAEQPGEVALAIWFHDAIYETRRHDNEAESAAWAARVLTQAGAAAAVVGRVHALIMATRHDGAVATADARLLVDIDLAILGATPARFAEYERQIRDEYAHVPEALFREKRAEILRTFQAREPLFGTPAFVAAFEGAAKANLARAIAALA